MKKIAKTSILTLCITIASITISAQNGEKNFKAVCAVCHTIGKGMLVGPDLKGTHAKYDEQWLVKWIKSSQTLVKENDPKAVELFNKYKVPMPDNNISDDEIKEIIAYIKTTSEAPATPAVAQTSQSQTTTTELLPEAKKSTSDNFFMYLGIGLVIIFFTVVIGVLWKAVRVLSNELKSLNKN